LKKFLAGVMCLAILTLTAFAEMDEVKVWPVKASGDISTALSDADYGRLALVCDSSGDSTFGNFQTESYVLDGANAAIAYARVGRMGINNGKDSTFDSLVIRLDLITACEREAPGFSYCTLSTDSIVGDTGIVEYWLGSCDGFTGTDSLFELIWWEGSMTDSTSDSANYGNTHDIWMTFGIKKR